MSSMEALRKDLAAAEAALRAARELHASMVRELNIAQLNSGLAFEVMTSNARNVDRYKAAIAALENDDY